MDMMLRTIVSKKKKRYKEDGFNLDLTYICDNIIAMGFPAKNLEAVYRNHIDDVIKFLNKKHDQKYKIYNLCEEKKYQYDLTKFQHCAIFPFSDHNPPNIELIQAFCNDVGKWLGSDPTNVAAIHCRAGKGRTGTMICCYLLRSRHSKTAEEALNFYAQKRTTDKKGVTIPSQRRYVEYYAQLLTFTTPYVKVVMEICEIRLYNLPSSKTFGEALKFSISSITEGKLYSDQLTDFKRVDDYVSIKLQPFRVAGDIKVEFMCTQIMKRKHKLFHYWFNTYFLRDEVPDSGYIKLELDKYKIDDAHKDKQKLYPDNFKIQTILQKIPHNTRTSLNLSSNNNHHSDGLRGGHMNGSVGLQNMPRFHGNSSVNSSNNTNRAPSECSYTETSSDSSTEEENKDVVDGQDEEEGDNAEEWDSGEQKFL